jgi:hypothetical protein
MADNQIDVGFKVDTDSLKSGMDEAGDQISQSLAAIQAGLDAVRASALSAYAPLHTLAEEPTSTKAIEDSFAAQVSQIEQLKALHQISADDAIQQEIRVENARYAALRAELDATLQCMTDEADAREKMQEKADALEEKHNAKLLQLDLQAAKDSEQAWNAIVAPIESAFQSSLNQVITGHENLRQALAHIGQSIVTDFADTALKRVTSWITSELAMTSATNVGNAARTASDSAAATASTGFSFAKALDEIGANAARVYASVFAWASPVLGPLAAVPAAAASALVIAQEVLIPSAAGGFDVPSGLNPLTQLHQREMVLPQQYADVIRNLAGSGGGGANIHADFSGATFAAGLQPSAFKGAVVAALRQAHREGAFT